MYLISIMEKPGKRFEWITDLTTLKQELLNQIFRDLGFRSNLSYFNTAISPLLCWQQLFPLSSYGLRNVLVDVDVGAFQLSGT